MLEGFKDFFVSEDPALLKKRQYLLALGVLAILLGLLGSLAFWGRSCEPPAERLSSETAKEIESGGNRVKPEEVWRFRMEEDNRKLRDALQKIQTSLETAQKEETHRQDRSAYEQKLEMTLQDLQSQLAQKTVSPLPPAPESFPVPGGFPGDLSQGTGTPLIQKFTFQRGEEALSLKTVKNTLPAGAFVRSVLLSGVDVSTAMTESQNPRPLLLRLVDSGTLPRKFRSDLKDCHLTGAAHGDLSSERVYVRLEKLTCLVRKTGEIIETEVTGYVTGSDGKAGIRGKVVSKDAAFLERSLIGGLFSGLSNIANPQNRQNMVNPFAAGNPKVDAPSAKNMFASGMAEGATNALDRLSQYYINRAEQLQPVIQVSAGQGVDVVFTEGVAFGSQGVRERLARARERASSSPSSFPDSQKQGTGESPSSSFQSFPPGDAS